LAAIFAEPQVDEHRRVYADWLSERGDSRGEFILLQLMEHDGGATKLSGERARQLIRMHAKAWLGPLDHVLDRKRLVFERGFPIRGCCKPGLRKPERYFNEPGWASFEHLRDPPLGLLRQPSVSSLRSISLHRDQALQLIREAEPLPNIQALKVRATQGRGSVIMGEEQAMYQRSTCLPALASVRFNNFQMGLPGSWYWAMTMSQVRRFAVYADIRPRFSPAAHWAQWLRGLSTKLEFVTVGDPQLEVTVGHIETGDWAQATLRLLTVSPTDARVSGDLDNLRAHGITQIVIEPRPD
jgi:uncharacterized protein (TIGR02996 family)